MSLSLRTLPTFAIALLLGTSAVAQAQQERGRGEPRPQRARQDNSTLSDSVRRAQRDTDGQVLGAERVPYDGRDVNRIKLIDGRGRVRVYMDDPQRQRESGERRQESGDDPRAPPTRNDDD